MKLILFVAVVLFILIGIATPFLLFRCLWVIPGKLQNIENEIKQLRAVEEERKKMELKRLANEQAQKNQQNV